MEMIGTAKFSLGVGLCCLDAARMLLNASRHNLIQLLRHCCAALYRVIQKRIEHVKKCDTVESP